MSKLLWKILLILVAGLTLWYGSIAAYRLCNYYRLNDEIPAEVTQWEIIPKGSKYALEANFNYEYKKKKFTNSSIFPKPYYFNKPSAEAEIKKMSGMAWSAWVDSSHPEYSSLIKHFPMREVFYALILLGLFLYFVYLKYHLEFLNKSY